MSAHAHVIDMIKADAVAFHAIFADAETRSDAGTAPEEDAHDAPSGGDLTVTKLLRHDGVVFAQILERGADEFVTTSKLDENFHGQLILALNVLEYDQAALFVLYEEFRPEGKRRFESLLYTYKRYHQRSLSLLCADVWPQQRCRFS